MVGRFLEGILRDTISSHLEENGLFKDSQRGSVLGRSCLAKLIGFLKIFLCIGQ